MTLSEARERAEASFDGAVPAHRLSDFLQPSTLTEKQRGEIALDDAKRMLIARRGACADALAKLRAAKVAVSIARNVRSRKLSAVEWDSALRNLRSRHRMMHDDAAKIRALTAALDALG